MKGFLFANRGALVNAVNTTKINNPKKKRIDAISETPINHLSPTVPGIIILKKST
jgi:hypothetical protein